MAIQHRFNAITFFQLKRFHLIPHLVSCPHLMPERFIRFRRVIFPVRNNCNGLPRLLFTGFGAASTTPKLSRVPLLVFLHTSPCHGMTSHLLLVLHFCTASTHHKAPLRAAEMAANGMDKVT